jgi:hypothetical protein
MPSYLFDLILYSVFGGSQYLGRTDFVVRYTGVRVVHLEDIRQRGSPSRIILTTAAVYIRRARGFGQKTLSLL